ncbi:MAG: hypothetical protein ACKO0M_09475, partial [Cyanobium sp.]
DQTFLALLLLLCTALGLLVMTMGGLGTLFAAFVSPVLRSLNRFTVFVYGASVLLLVSECELWLRHRQPGDRRGLLWVLLGFWTGVELLFSSGWWPPGARPVVVPASPARNDLRSHLSRQPGPRVWFAPYTTYPESGFVESTVRRGVYDTFLAFPSRTNLASNYGAGKLSPADSLFSQASVRGLPAEAQLARQLGYQLFVLDLGALSDPAAAKALCRVTPGCWLSADAYALFPLRRGGDDLSRALAPLHRRIPLLPWSSAGITWGPLVFSPYEWGVTAGDAQRPIRPGSTTMLDARPQMVLELFRYRLDQFPAVARAGLRLRDGDVQLVLPAEVLAARLCIGPADGPCRSLTLGPARRRVSIGSFLVPGQITRLEIVELLRLRPGEVPLQVELAARSAGG